nr:MAG TPA: hypothetical protein [Caudoviricetes sp.]
MHYYGLYFHVNIAILKFQDINKQRYIVKER